MKKLFFTINIIITLAICSVFLSGCSFVTTLLRDEKVEVMDFNQPLELKKPVRPVKKNPSILFIGNSFTYYHELPSVFLELSVSGGFEPDIYDLTAGSYRLQMFADENDEVGSQVYDALKNYEWDYVVLQEQSRIPAMAPEDLMYPAARTLDTMIHQANGETVFFMTWAYKEGDSYEVFGKEHTNTREEMQTKLAQGYIKIADELDSMLVPAGIAFIRCASQHPDIELWDEDLNHSSPAGTYLTACVFYASLFGQSPAGLAYTAEVNAQTAAILQQVAAETVLIE